GWLASNLVPLGLIGAGLLGHGFRQRSAGYAFATGLVVNLAASLIVGYFQQAAPLGTWWVSFLQANGIASAAAALVWLANRQRFAEPLAGESDSGSLLGTQIGLGLFSNVVWLLPALVQLVLVPEGP